jgi:Zn finger protein HypA/HybF involved in hydrogenase expression
MSTHTPYYELRCRQCSWTEVCGAEGMVRWLLKIGKIRHGREPDLDILTELFHAMTGQLVCPECGATGLAASPVDDAADWPEERPCAACGKLISAERLEALPDATLCAACQRAEEEGRTEVDLEYCPRCGAPMTLRPSTGGVTRYKLVCTANPPCRL